MQLPPFLKCFGCVKATIRERHLLLVVCGRTYLNLFWCETTLIWRNEHKPRLELPLTTVIVRSKLLPEIAARSPASALVSTSSSSYGGKKKRQQTPDLFCSVQHGHWHKSSEQSFSSYLHGDWLFHKSAGGLVRVTLNKFWRFRLDYGCDLEVIKWPVGVEGLRGVLGRG